MLTSPFWKNDESAQGYIWPGVPPFGHSYTTRIFLHTQHCHLPISQTRNDRWEVSWASNDRKAWLRLWNHQPRLKCEPLVIDHAPQTWKTNRVLQDCERTQGTRWETQSQWAARRLERHLASTPALLWKSVILVVDRVHRMARQIVVPRVFEASSTDKRRSLCRRNWPWASDTLTPTGMPSCPLPEGLVHTSPMYPCQGPCVHASTSGFTDSTGEFLVGVFCDEPSAMRWFRVDACSRLAADYSHSTSGQDSVPL